MTIDREAEAKIRDLANALFKQATAGGLSPRQTATALLCAASPCVAYEAMNLDEEEGQAYVEGMAAFFVASNRRLGRGHDAGPRRAGGAGVRGAGPPRALLCGGAGRATPLLAGKIPCQSA